MIPMIDSAVLGLGTTTTLTIDPTVMGVLVVLLALVAWVVSGVASELRHVPTVAHVDVDHTERLAA